MSVSKTAGNESCLLFFVLSHLSQPPSEGQLHDESLPCHGIKILGIEGHLIREMTFTGACRKMAQVDYPQRLTNSRISRLALNHIHETEHSEWFY